MNIQLAKSAVKTGLLYGPTDVEANAELVRVLSGIPADPALYGPWWGTTDGLALLDALTHRLGVPVTRAIASLYGFSQDPDEAAHEAISTLSPALNGRIYHRGPELVGVLYRTMHRELTRLAGSHFREQYSEAVELAVAPYDPAARTYNKMASAAELVNRDLQAFVPKQFHEGLEEVVYHLADRSYERLSRACTEIPKDPELIALGFTESQLRGITNVVLGSRPKFAETSLLAAYVRDDEWVYPAEGTHHRALQRLERRFTTEEKAA